MRIVSLCPSLTETVFALGRGDELVGITDYCVHPAAEVARVEKVGGTKTPDVARIVALAPDCVLMNEEENRLEDAEELQHAGLRCHVTLPRTLPETAAMMRSLGRLLERRNESEIIAVKIERAMARSVARAQRQSRVRFAYLIWRQPWMSVNDDTYPHALLAEGGGVNVFAGKKERYPQVALQELGRLAPDLILLGSEPFSFEQMHVEELSRDLGLPVEGIRLADGELLNWHGARTPDGIAYAAQILEPAKGGQT